MLKERPILFNGDMVRALLDGRKTQTRRVIKSPPPEGCGLIEVGTFAPIVIDQKGEQQPGPDTFGAFSECGEWGLKCPYGQPGDRLWVRENFLHLIHGDEPESGVKYCASIDSRSTGSSKNPGYWWRKRPSIHMPRWASRITLEIVSVRVERLQEVTLGDICKEGIARSIYEFIPATDGFRVWRGLWESINGAESWASNPWVWVVEFKCVEASQ
ncbi:unnamed protein product [Ectocarpus sp. 12 AP-2014]